jgi:predicted metalloprotease with PDZ domain
MYVDGLLNVPATVHVITPARWQIITSMRSLSGTTFEATDYDELADSPILCGDLTVEIFDVAGVPHRLAIAGQGNYDLAAVTDDLRKIVQAGADLFGGLPYDRYDFQVMLSDTGGGGLEHSFSNACIFPRLTFRPRKSYERFLAVEAHEHFHAWLVKRIRPQALLPYRYEAEQYTRLLWLMEGMTEYYADRTLLRAGLISSQRYLERLADDIGQLEQTAGRRLQSLEEASFDAWIKHYRPDENTENSSVSYYLKGSLVAAILDLVIRSTTANERSLDDALRALWEDRNVRREGLPEDGAQQMLEAAVGTDLSAVFDRYVRGLDDIDWNHYLGLAGLAVRSTGAGAESDGGTPYLGAKFRRDGLFPVVESVRAGSPAYQAGLSPGDEIVAIDGIRVTRTGWDERLEALGVGETVRLAVFRRGILIEVPVTLGAAPATKYEIVPLEEATPAQTAVRRSWLGE